MIGATGYVIMARLDREAFSYLMYPPAVLNGDMDMALADWIIQFAYLMLLLGNFIPVSLYVSMSTIRFFQAIFMEWDRHMYHEPVDHHCEVHHHSITSSITATRTSQQLMSYSSCSETWLARTTIPHPTSPPSMTHAACLPAQGHLMTQPPVVPWVVLSAGSHDEPERGAGPGVARVHRQDRHAHLQHHGVPKVLHQRLLLRTRGAAPPPTIKATTPHPPTHLSATEPPSCCGLLLLSL